MNEEKSRLDSKYSEKSNKRERKSPRCGRCEVHGKYSLLKGHKEDCKYRDCKCPGCQIYLREQRVSADKIFLKRDRDLKKKRKLLPQEIPASPVAFNTKRTCHLHILLNHTYSEMCRDWWYSPMMKRILGALKYYADIFDEGIKIDSFLEDAKNYMSQVINDPLFMSEYPRYCYFSPRIIKAPDEEQFVGINSSHASQKLPDLIPESEPLSTSTALSSDILFNKPPTEPSINPLDLSRFSTHYW